MKNIKKLLIVFVLIITSLVFVKAEEIKEVKLTLINLPEEGKDYESWYGFSNGYVTNTDKVLADDIYSLTSSPVAGTTVKVYVELNPKSVNDWLSENTKVTAQTPAGQKTLQRDWDQTHGYVYYFEYVIPETQITKYEVKFYSTEDTEYYYYNNYIFAGTEYTIQPIVEYSDTDVPKALDYFTLEGDATGKKYYVGDKVTVNSALTFIPHFKDVKTYKISYVVDGKPVQVYSNAGNVVDYIVQPEGTQLMNLRWVSFAEPLQNGLTITDAYLDSSYTHKIEDTDVLEEDLTIYYKSGYYIYAEPIDGMGRVYDKYSKKDEEYYADFINAGENRTIIVVAEAEEGYEFKGWKKFDYENYEYTDTVSTNPEYEWKVSLDNRSVGAIFEKVPEAVSVKYIEVGDNVEEDAEINRIYVLPGKILDKPATIYKPNYEVNDWCLDRECTQVFDFKTPISADTVLYTKWVKTNKIVYANSIYGGDYFDVQFVEKGQKVKKPTIIPKKEGNEFSFWASYNYYGRVSNVEEYNFDTPVYVEHDISAQFAYQYEISFNTNGGAAIPPMKASNAKYRNISLPKPAKDGFRFVGWYLDEGLTKEFDPKTYKFKNNITLYAKYEVAQTGTVTNSTIKITKGEQNTALLELDNFYTDQKYTLYKSTNKKKWSKVAVLTSESYNVTGITFGQKTYYRVTVELGKKKVNTNTVDIKVYPDAAKNLKVESVGATNIKVAWDKAPYSGYEVQRSENGTKWKKVATISKSSTLTYNNKKLKSAKTYYYRVRPYKKVKGKKVYGGWSNVVSDITGPGKPKNPSIKATKYNEITLGLKAAKTATKYEIQRSTNKKKNFATIGFTTELTYVDTVDTGRTYYYKVRACDDRNICGGWTKVVSKKTSLSKPSLTSTSETTVVEEVKNSKVTLTVNPVDGAEGYVIQKSTKNAKKGFKNLADTTELTVEDTNVKQGKTVYYKVRAYRLVNGKKVYSGYSKVIKVKVQ